MASLISDGFVEVSDTGSKIFKRWVSEEEYQTSAEENKAWGLENGIIISYYRHTRIGDAIKVHWETV